MKRMAVFHNFEIINHFPLWVQCHGAHACTSWYKIVHFQ